MHIDSFVILCDNVYGLMTPINSSKFISKSNRRQRDKSTTSDKFSENLRPSALCPSRLTHWFYFPAKSKNDSPSSGSRITYIYELPSPITIDRIEFTSFVMHRITCGWYEETANAYVSISVALNWPHWSLFVAFIYILRDVFAITSGEHKR